MVSIVIPVYNVEKYIDVCMESVVHQTHSDIEILVMEAKSTDNSLEKLIGWAKDDDRVTIVSRKDGGLGPGRNFAIRMVQGEYVTFLDSDDWFEYDYIEKMLETIEKDPEIDIVFSEVKFHFEKLNISRFAHNSWPNGIYDGIVEKKRMMRYGNNSIWGKLYRTSLFVQNNIIQPSLPFEDLSVYPELLAMSRKIAICNQTYIHYRTQREGSLFGINDNYKKFPEVMKWGENGLKKTGLFEIYEKAFDFTMYYHLRNICKKYVNISDIIEIKKIFLNENEYFNNRFSKFRDLNGFLYWGYGSFTVRWVIHRLENGKQNLKEHFAFTNLIAQMTNCQDDLKIDFNTMSILRKEWLLNDIHGHILQLLKSEKVIMPDVFIIDFIYECQNVIRLLNGNYITCSELLNEIENSMPQMDMVLYDSPRFIELWEKKCDHFIELLKNRNIKNVILLENYYPQFYILNGKYYKYKKDYTKQNNILKGMYSYFKKKWESITVYLVPEEFKYTDVTGQKYEISPFYLNSQAYNCIAEQIDTKRFM